MRIAPERRRADKAKKGRELPAGNYRSSAQAGGRPAAAGGSLDDALAAVAWATEGRGQGQPALDQNLGVPPSRFARLATALEGSVSTTLSRALPPLSPVLSPVQDCLACCSQA